MKKMNILFLTSNFPPNLSVGTQRVTKILKYISDEDFHFHVLTLKEDYFPSDLDAYLKNGRLLPKNVTVSRTDKLELTRFFTSLKAMLKKTVKGGTTGPMPKKSTKPSGDSSGESTIKQIEKKVRGWLFSIFEFPDKYIGWLPYAVKRGVKLVRENNIDAILTTAPPHSLFIMAWLIKKRTGAKLILDFRDPWALSIWDFSKSLTSRMEQYYERKIIAAADKVVFVTEKMRDRYAEFYGQEMAAKFEFFSNGFDPDDFKDLASSPPSVTDKKTIDFVHLGTLYKKRNPEPLFRALASIIKTGNLETGKIKMGFIGFVASELDYLKKLVVELKLEGTVYFKDPVGFKESLNIMQQADVLLIIQPGTDMQIPAKLFEYMYTGKPIFALAEPDSATESVILKGNLGYVAFSDDIETISEKLLEMVNSLGNRDETDVNGYAQRFDMSKAITRFEEVLKNA